MPRRRDEDEDQPQTTSESATPRRSARSSRQLPGSRRPSAEDSGARDAGARPADLSVRLTGVVNKHFPDKGFGFIREDQTGREYFFHYEGTKEGTRDAFLERYTEGVLVQFEGRNGPKGWRASAVELQ